MLTHFLITQDLIEKRSNGYLSLDKTDQERYDQLYKALNAQELETLNGESLFQSLKELYSSKGAPAKNQAQIFYSIYLFNNSDYLSLTKWVNTLKVDPVYKVLVGLDPEEPAPSIGSHYNFCDRMAGRSDELSKHIHPKGFNKKKPKTPKGSQKAQDPNATATCQDLANKILEGQDCSDQQTRFLNELFFSLAVETSMKIGLIPSNNIKISGDGTCLPIHANPNGTHRQNLQPGFRYFSDPSCNWGWDSHEKRHFFGHAVYFLNYYNETEKKDLPLRFDVFPASAHDSSSYLKALSGLGQYLDLNRLQTSILDAAHDNMATYSLHEALDIESVIDLNTRSCKPADKKGKSFNEYGTPICESGEKMKFKGYSQKRTDLKWVCPNPNCAIACSCKSFYVNCKKDLRYYTRKPRESEQFKKEYNKRTACERINKQVLVDHKVEVRGFRKRSLNDVCIFMSCLSIHLKAQNAFKAR